MQQYNLEHEIDSFVALSSHVGQFVLVHCVSGTSFRIEIDDAEQKLHAHVWSGSRLIADGNTTIVKHIVIGVKSNEKRNLVAYASVAGIVSLETSLHEQLWSLQIPEAIAGMDRLSFTDDQDIVRWKC